MAPERWPARALRALAIVVFAALLIAPAAHALRVVDYNVTNYPGVLFPQRQPYFRTVLAPLGADVLVCQEFSSQAGVDSFRTNVLNVIEPGQWLSAPFVNGNDTDNALFYKPAKVQFLGSWFFYPNPANLLRLVCCYRLKPVGYASSAAELRIYSQHLKASTGSTNVAQRLAEATGIRDSMNAMPPGTCAILCGDFNIYTSTEGAFQKLLESQVDNDGRLYDPLNAVGTFNASGFAPIHTQCPCLTCPAGSGFSGGGLDDRFDMFLPTYSLKDGEGLDLLTPTYKPVGNDGLHYNLNITDPPTIPEGAAYASALWNASDHLPIRVDLQVPARISAPAVLAFGNVIVGATANQLLPVSNTAIAPADELTYSMVADPGFTAPGASFVANAGAPATNHTINMDTSAPGTPSGFLLISSNDPDNPALATVMSGTVLAHAQASLDSTTALASQSLDFGTHVSGGFPTLMARVHDRGFDALRARLALATGVITGGDGRFSIVGGFSPALVSGTARTHTLQFNDAGATPDLDYDATLTFTSADEPLPGATAQPDLTVSLHARMSSSAVGVPGGPSLPSVTRLYAPYPNPVVDGARVRLDLALEADVKLEIHDVEGRRVATLASGTLPVGRYTFPWGARGDGGARLGSGLYFVRLTIAGRPVQTTRLALVR
jgi:FlgD Ig-like domain